jgi:hypothetical protein
MIASSRSVSNAEPSGARMVFMVDTSMCQMRRRDAVPFGVARELIFGQHASVPDLDVGPRPDREC